MIMFYGCEHLPFAENGFYTVLYVGNDYPHE